MALDLLVHALVLHHVIQFQNFYLVFLSVSLFQGIAPCYAILELRDFLEITVTWPYIVSSREPPDLKIKEILYESSVIFLIIKRRKGFDPDCLISGGRKILQEILCSVTNNVVDVGLWGPHRLRPAPSVTGRGTLLLLLLPVSLWKPSNHGHNHSGS